MAEFSGEAVRQVNTVTADNQVHAVAAALAGGGHVVAWTTTGSNAAAVEADAQVYDAAGAPVGPEITLAAGYSAGGVAALADGSFIVSLTQDTTGPDFYPRSAVYYAHFDATGMPLGAPVLVDGSGTYDAAVDAGSVFALPGGGFAIDDVSITRPTPVSTSTHSIRVFDASGAPVESIAAGENFVSRIQAMADGGFVYADQPYTGPGPSRISWHVTDAQGHVTAEASLASTYGQSDYESPAVVALANGGAVVVWDAMQGTGGTLTAHWQAQLIDASGHATGAAFDWGFTGAGSPKLTALADGGFLASWTTQASYGAPDELYAQSFDASAHADGTIEHLATLGAGDAPFDTGYSVTATADGGFIVDWQRSADGQDIFEEKFDAIPASSGGTVRDADGTLDLGGAHTQYSVASGSITGPDGTVSLAGIERVHFADDFALAFDVNGDAGEAYRLYQAAFDRAPDLPGLGYHISDLDHGVPLWLVAQHFIDSPEFQATYGATDDTQFISLLYQNVLHRAPDGGGLQFHLDEFAHGESRADMLIHFSESPENEANVIGAIGNGMLYVPLAA
ncbi:MAG TPA: DUF4214 domain-containing protein [Ramlibacter sp.]